MTVVMHNILSATGRKVTKRRHILLNVGKQSHVDNDFQILQTKKTTR